jgi:hypothetical protein
MTGFAQLTKHGLSIEPPATAETWSTLESNNMLLRRNNRTNKVELIAKLDTNLGKGKGKPGVDIVTPSNLAVLANATTDALPGMYDLSGDEDGKEAYASAYGQAVKDLAAAAENAGLPLTIGEIQDQLKILMAQPGTKEGFGRYEIDDFGRNSFDVDLFRQDVASLRDSMFGTQTTAPATELPEGLTEEDIAENIARGYTREEVIAAFQAQGK